jgi:hypothetical protein
MPKNDKSPDPPKPEETSTPAAQDKPAADKPAATGKPASAKKKLTLDVTDVNEVLERKISP